MTNPANDPLEATRVAEIDPVLGVERRGRSIDVEATVISGRALCAPTHKKTALFIPALGRVGAEDSTAAWKDGLRADAAPRPPVLLASMLRRLRTLGRPRSLKLLGLLLLLPVVAFGAYLGRPRTARPSAVVSTPEPQSAADSAVSPSPKPAAPNAPPAATHVRTAHLVDAIAEGRVDDARGIAGSLAAASPNDGVLRAVLEILSLDSAASAP